ncbi:MAG: hypothetical protein DME86_12585, partial [Verrucomicrobia bacterium]
KFLGQWEGILQTDGYQAYDTTGGPKLVRVGCWAHYLDHGFIQSETRDGHSGRSGLGVN